MTRFKKKKMIVRVIVFGSFVFVLKLLAAAAGISLFWKYENKRKKLKG